MAGQDCNLLPSTKMSIPTHSHPEVLSGKGLSSQSPVSGLTQKTSFPCIWSQLVWKLHYQSLIWLTLSPTPGWHCESPRRGTGQGKGEGQVVTPASQERTTKGSEVPTHSYNLKQPLSYRRGRVHAQKPRLSTKKLSRGLTCSYGK